MSGQANLLSLYLVERPFYAIANRADSDQATLLRAAWSGSTLFAKGKYDIWYNTSRPNK